MFCTAFLLSISFRIILNLIFYMNEYLIHYFNRMHVPGTYSKGFYNESSY